MQEAISGPGLAQLNAADDIAHRLSQRFTFVCRFCIFKLLPDLCPLFPPLLITICFNPIHNGPDSGNNFLDSTESGENGRDHCPSFLSNEASPSINPCTILSGLSPGIILQTASTAKRTLINAPNTATNACKICGSCERSERINAMFIPFP